MFGTATAALGAVLGGLQGRMSVGDLQQGYGDCRAGRELCLEVVLDPLLLWCYQRGSAAKLVGEGQ